MMVVMKKRMVAMILNLLFEVSVCGLDDVFFFTCGSEVLCLYEAEECREERILRELVVRGRWTRTKREDKDLCVSKRCELIVASERWR